MQLYDKLLGLPLFQGLSSSDLQDIVTRVRFGFYKYNRNAIIADEGTACRGILFVLDGEVEVTTSSADHSFYINEYPSTPLAIEPERTFGLYQHYAHSYRAKTACHCIFVGKDDVMLLATEFIVFRLNLLNIISTQSQRATRQLWRHADNSIESRVVRFFQNHSTIPVGKKVFRIKMQTLADIINISRLEASQVLNNLHDQQKIILQRGIITIPRLETL